MIPVLVLPMNDKVRNGSIENVFGQFINELYNASIRAVDIKPNANRDIIWIVPPSVPAKPIFFSFLKFVIGQK